MPNFLYGTAWKEERTQALTELALSSGFVGIDTANQRKHYFEAGVGAALTQALARGTLTRAGLFLQSKFTYVRGQDQRLPYDPQASVGTQVRQSLLSSLEHLNTTYLDAYLLHGPAKSQGLTDSDWEVWRALEALQAEGKTRLLGVSNVDLPQLQLLCEGARVLPACVQNRCYAATGWDAAVRRFCRANGIVYQAFSLLTANRRELQTPAYARVVERLRKTREQITFRFAQQVGMLPITGTSSAAHQHEALQVTSFDLRAEELDAIERCGLS